MATAGTAKPRPTKRARKGPGPRWQRGGNADVAASFPIMSDEDFAKLTIPAATLDSYPEKLRAVLAEHGVAAVSGILTPEECDQLELCWRDDLLELVDTEPALSEAHVEAIQAMKEGGGIDAWPDTCNKHIGSAKRGFATLRGTPHGRFAWGCRLHPRVKQTFAAIHDVAPDAMCSGLDNVMWQSHGKLEEPVVSNPEWLHCDQNHNTGLVWPIFQGILYVRSATDPRASTTVVWPQSHGAVYERIMSDPRSRKLGESAGGQLVKLSTLTSDGGKALHAAAMAGAVRMPIPAGALLLWDSRTVHQGWRGGARLAMPVCWEPSERREYTALRRKLWMCATGVSSSHSSTEGRIHAMGPKAPAEVVKASSSRGALRLPLRRSLVPQGIRPDKVDEWKEMEEELWANGRATADKIDPDSVRTLLRDEIVAVL
eukprot:m.339904 g.339904  ORF g.339904 m.339904 type:complete len:429 (-) comp16543_c6_seq9:56-1342(-)